MRRAAADIALAPHCAATLAKAARLGVPTTVVSVNWSTDYINAALGPALGPEGQGLAVRANELARGGDGATTGDIVRCVGRGLQRPHSVSA